MAGEYNLNTGELKIIGVGQAKSRGVRKAEITDPTLAEEDVRHAIAEVEQMADAEVRSVLLGVSGGHLRGFNNHGVHPVVSEDREIGQQDVNDVIKNAKAINLPAENYVVHAIRQHFVVDGQNSIRDPVGMFGSRVEVNMHVLHGNFNRLQNPVRAVKGLHLGVDGLVFNGLASALSLLSNEQKELGALVIDLGGGVTEYVVYSGGIVKHTGVLGVGGDHVSNDLAYGLKVPLGRAEELKVEHGGAMVDETVLGKTITLDTDSGIPEEVNLEHLRRIMSVRLEEIFQLVEEELAQLGLLAYLRAGVFLSGGGARIPQIQKLAERVFQMPATLGGNRSMEGLNPVLDQPEFGAPLGLVKYGTFQERNRDRSGRLSKGLRSAVNGLLKRSG